MSFLRDWTPEFVKELQDTEQLVDGAVAEHQRRRDKFRGAIDEAEQLAGELAERKQS